MMQNSVMDGMTSRFFHFWESELHQKGFKRVRGEKERNYIKNSPKAIATSLYEAGLDAFNRSSNIAGFS